MIREIKKITSENPSIEVWKYLRFFLHAPSVEQRIYRLHNPSSKYESDVRKQAKQIGYCIRQAEEYFKASSQVGLATRPLLLYYGASSLSQALVLLKNDGRYSLDAQRKEKRHKHHGLDPVGFEELNSSEGVEAFFTSLTSRLHTEKDEPWGQFANFYNNLIPSVFTVNTTVRNNNELTYIKYDAPQNCADLAPIQSLITVRFDALSLIKTLPDLNRTLFEIGIHSELCRAKIEREIIYYYKPTPLNSVNSPTPEFPLFTKDIETVIDKHDIFINDISVEQKAHVLKFYKERNPQITLAAEFPLHLHLKLLLEAPEPEMLKSLYYPDMVEDVTGQPFLILHPETYIHEVAAMYILLYSLGMLVRYYPDKWMKVLEVDVQLVELTNTLLNIIHRKFPNLILDQMTEVKHNTYI